MHTKRIHPSLRLEGVVGGTFLRVCGLCTNPDARAHARAANASAGDLYQCGSGCHLPTRFATGRRGCNATTALPVLPAKHRPWRASATTVALPLLGSGRITGIHGLAGFFLSRYCTLVATGSRPTPLNAWMCVMGVPLQWDALSVLICVGGWTCCWSKSQH